MPRITGTVCAALLLLAVSAGCGPGPGPGGPSPQPSGVATGGPATDPPTTAAPTSSAPAPTSAADPWLLSTDGIGPYRLGQRIDSMPASILGSSTPIDSANCPDLYGRAATGMYAGVILLVVRHNVLVEIGSAGGDPGVHSPNNDRVGDAWATVEGRHPTGSYHTQPGTGARAFIVPAGDRVMMFHVNPIRPGGVGSYLVGMADHSQATFLSGAHC